MAYSPLKLHILFYSNWLATWYGFPNITHFEIDNCRMSAIFNLTELKFLRTYPSLKRHLLFNRNGLAIWQAFPVIKYIKVKSSWPLVGHLEFNKIDIFTVYPYLKPHISLNSNGLAIWKGFPLITYIQMLDQCWPTVRNAGQASNQHWCNA